MPGRILVIDDEPQITRVLRASLSAQGFDVRTANDCWSSKTGRQTW
jgi:two-component system KDP operon response regulator KdpE